METTRPAGKQHILEVQNLRVEFSTREGIAHVINDLTFDLGYGETVGIVGESGCGKTMTGLSIMGLVPDPPGRVAGGRILLEGKDLARTPESRMTRIRGKEISMIFQEPMTSLNPVFNIGEQIVETLQRHEGLSHHHAWEAAVDMLRAVRIPAAERRVREYPHQMSGGMRQRVMIAMALACNPKILIADEPTTALDVTVQAQILDLLKDLQNRTDTAIILITHDVGVIAETTRRTLVMYAGHKVEEGTTCQVIHSPRHPYTKGLIECIPTLQAHPDPERPFLREIPGVVPPLTKLGRGCPFAPRCPLRMDQCELEMPPLEQMEDHHSAACWAVSGSKDAERERG